VKTACLVDGDPRKFLVFQGGSCCNQLIILWIHTNYGHNMELTGGKSKRQRTMNQTM
jgi:hypothetical protein